MLKFNKSSRQQVEPIEESWTSLAREFAGSARQPTVRHNKLDQIKSHLKAVEKDEMQLTIKQLDRIISEYDNEKTKDDELKRSIGKVKAKLRT